MYFQTKSPSQTLPDNPAYNLHDHYVHVQKLCDTHPLQDEDAAGDHLAALTIKIAPPTSLNAPVCKFICDILSDDDIYYPDLMEEKYAFKEYLTQKERKLTNTQPRIDAATKAIQEFFTFLTNCEDPPESTLSVSVSLIETFDTPMKFIQAVINCFSRRFDDDYLFARVHTQLVKNILAVSGYTLEDMDRIRENQIIRPENSKLTPVEAVKAYFKDTPLEELLG